LTLSGILATAKGDACAQDRYEAADSTFRPGMSGNGRFINMYDSWIKGMTGVCGIPGFAETAPVCTIISLVKKQSVVALYNFRAGGRDFGRLRQLPTGVWDLLWQILDISALIPQY